MKVRVLIAVYLDSKCYASGKQIFSRVFERSIYEIDCKELYRSFRQLFGDSCIVTFKIEDNATI